MEQQPETVSFSEFKAEMDAKNEAYEFILSMRLYNEFVAFCKYSRARNKRLKMLEENARK